MTPHSTHRPTCASWLLALLALVCLMPSYSYAQRGNYPKSLWIGVHGGMQFSRFSFSPTVSQHAHPGQWGGMALRYDLEKGASLQLELNYSLSGWKEKYEEGSTLAYRRDLKYIEMPILGHLYLGGQSARVYVGAGPVVGWLIGEGSSSSGEGFGDAATLRHSMTVQRKLFWGLAAAPGLSIALGGRHRIELEGRFTIGYGDLWRNARTEPYGQSSAMRYGAGLRYLYRL